MMSTVAGSISVAAEFSTMKNLSKNSSSKSLANDNKRRYQRLSDHLWKSNSQCGDASSVRNKKKVNSEMKDYSLENVNNRRSQRHGCDISLSDNQNVTLSGNYSPVIIKLYNSNDSLKKCSLDVKKNDNLITSRHDQDKYIVPPNIVSPFPEYSLNCTPCNNVKNLFSPLHSTSSSTHNAPLCFNTVTDWSSILKKDKLIISSLTTETTNQQNSNERNCEPPSNIQLHNAIPIQPNELIQETQQPIVSECLPCNPLFHSEIPSPSLLPTGYYPDSTTLHPGPLLGIPSIHTSPVILQNQSVSSSPIEHILHNETSLLGQHTHHTTKLTPLSSFLKPLSSMDSSINCCIESIHGTTILANPHMLQAHPTHHCIPDSTNMSKDCLQEHHYKEDSIYTQSNIVNKDESVLYNKKLSELNPNHTTSIPNVIINKSPCPIQLSPTSFSYLTSPFSNPIVSLPHNHLSSSDFVNNSSTFPVFSSHPFGLPSSLEFHTIPTTPCSTIIPTKLSSSSISDSARDTLQMGLPSPMIPDFHFPSSLYSNSPSIRHPFFNISFENNGLHVQLNHESDSLYTQPFLNKTHPAYNTSSSPLDPDTTSRQDPPPSVSSDYCHHVTTRHKRHREFKHRSPINTHLTDSLTPPSHNVKHGSSTNSELTCTDTTQIIHNALHLIGPDNKKKKKTTRRLTGSLRYKQSGDCVSHDVDTSSTLNKSFVNIRLTDHSKMIKHQLNSTTSAASHAILPVIHPLDTKDIMDTKQLTQHYETAVVLSPTDSITQKASCDPSHMSDIYPQLNNQEKIKGLPETTLMGHNDLSQQSVTHVSPEVDDHSFLSQEHQTHTKQMSSSWSPMRHVMCPSSSSSFEYEHKDKNYHPYGIDSCLSYQQLFQLQHIDSTLFNNFHQTRPPYLWNRNILLTDECGPLHYVKKNNTENLFKDNKTGHHHHHNITLSSKSYHLPDHYIHHPTDTMQHNIEFPLLSPMIQVKQEGCISVPKSTRHNPSNHTGYYTRNHHSHYSFPSTHCCIKCSTKDSVQILQREFEMTDQQHHSYPYHHVCCCERKKRRLDVMLDPFAFGAVLSSDIPVTDWRQYLIINQKKNQLYQYDSYPPPRIQLPKTNVINDDLFIQENTCQSIQPCIRPSIQTSLSKMNKELINGDIINKSHHTLLVHSPLSTILQRVLDDASSLIPSYKEQLTTKVADATSLEEEEEEEDVLFEYPPVTPVSILSDTISKKSETYDHHHPSLYYSDAFMDTQLNELHHFSKTSKDCRRTDRLKSTCSGHEHHVTSSPVIVSVGCLLKDSSL